MRHALKRAVGSRYDETKDIDRGLELDHSIDVQLVVLGSVGGMLDDGETVFE